MTKSEIAKRLEKSDMTVQRAIKKLIDNHFVEKVGSNKTGYWQAKRIDN